jgi:ATP-dependent Clp protease ATP-binding subunit ClpX
MCHVPQIKLSFTDGAIKAIARKALQKRTGARGLRAIVVCWTRSFQPSKNTRQEHLLTDAMFELPGSDVRQVEVCEEVPTHAEVGLSSQFR